MRYLNSLLAASAVSVFLLASSVGRSQDAATLPDQLNARLLRAFQGGVVELPDVDLDAIQELDYVKTILPGPQYLISDDPEYIRQPEAIAMSEEVLPGRIRLYVYNVNGVKEPEKTPRRISPVIENLGEGPMTIHMIVRAVAAPSANYHAVAKSALVDFMSETPPAISERIRTLELGGAMPLDPGMESSVANYDELVHGIFEFTVDQPARISVVQTSPETPSPEALAALQEVAPTKSNSGAGRGLFMTSNYRITLPENVALDPSDGPQALIIADGKRDPWVIGREGSSNATWLGTPTRPAILKGNYGIRYEIEIERRGAGDAGDLGYALITWNARGGAKWCDFMVNAMRVEEAVHPGGVVPIPGRVAKTAGAPETVLIQLYPPLPEGETETIKLTYSPPGATCLPTPLILMPVRFSK